MLSQLSLRRVAILRWLLTFVLWIALAFCAAAQDDVAPTPTMTPENTTTTITISQRAPRVGTPSFLGAVDTTLQTWSRYFRGYGPYVLIAIALAAAYLTGLIIYQIAFGLGSFAPKAGLLAAWFSASILLFFGLMMLPQGWPWWSPYVLIFFGLALTVLILSSFSKKAV